jgi:hypothetical protein
MLDSNEGFILMIVENLHFRDCIPLYSTTSEMNLIRDLVLDLFINDGSPQELLPVLTSARYNITLSAI